jgi:hypothetical protein
MLPATEAERPAREEPVPVMLALLSRGPRMEVVRAVQLMSGGRGDGAWSQGLCGMVWGANCQCWQALWVMDIACTGASEDAGDGLGSGGIQAGGGGVCVMGG